MATPRKKISKHKRNVRHSKWLYLNLTRLTEQFMQTKCSNCAKIKLSHRVCPHCGFYKGKQVITIKTGGGKQILEA